MCHVLSLRGVIIVAPISSTLVILDIPSSKVASLSIVDELNFSQKWKSVIGRREYDLDGGLNKSYTRWPHAEHIYNKDCVELEIFALQTYRLLDTYYAKCVYQRTFRS